MFVTVSTLLMYGVCDGTLVGVLVRINFQKPLFKLQVMVACGEGNIWGIQLWDLSCMPVPKSVLLRLL